MREILFRGKNLRGVWIFGNLNFYPDINRTFIRKNNKDLLPSFQTSLEEEVDKKTVGQFTGVVNNGKKIFEGDILKTKDGIYVCLWDDCNFEFAIKNNKESFGIAYMPLKDLKIIGNIHDNPELLKEREG